MHKLDADCEPAWTRRLDGSGEGYATIPSAVASDPQGDVYAVALRGPTVDLGPLSAIPATFATEINIYKFSADGEERYHRSYPIALGGNASGAIVDAQGRLFLTGLAGELSDFGGGPLGLSPSTFRGFLLALDAQGEHLGSQRSSFTYQFVRAGESLVFLDTTVEAVDVVGTLFGFHPNPTTPPEVTARDLPGLEERWRAPFDPTGFYPTHFRGQDDGSVVAFGNPEVEELEAPDEPGLRFAFPMAWYNPAGELSTPIHALTVLRRPVDGEYSYPPMLESMDAAPDGSAVAMLGRFEGELVLEDGSSIEGSRPYDPETPTARDLFAAKFGSEGELVWLRSLHVGEDPRPAGVAIDGDGHVWVASDARVPPDPDAAGADEEWVEHDVVITKLRAQP